MSRTPRDERQYALAMHASDERHTDSVRIREDRKPMNNTHYPACAGSCNAGRRACQTPTRCRVRSLLGALLWAKR